MSHPLEIQLCRVIIWRMIRIHLTMHWLRLGLKKRNKISHLFTFILEASYVGLKFNPDKIGQWACNSYFELGLLLLWQGFGWLKMTKVFQKDIEKSCHPLLDHVNRPCAMSVVISMLNLICYNDSLDYKNWRKIWRQRCRNEKRKFNVFLSYCHVPWEMKKKFHVARRGESGTCLISI